MANKLRDSEILNLLQKKECLTVDEIVDALYVSPSSVRRSLSALEEQGLIKRTHGGATVIDSNNLTPSFTYRTHQNVLEKKLIALKAVSLIKEGDVIFLDGSTSAFFMVEYLSEFKNIKVVTNGIDTLSLLSKNDIPAISTGGSICVGSRSILVGPFAEKAVDDIHANIAFFSAQAVNEDGVISDCHLEETQLVAKMIKNSARRVFLCDETKLSKTATFKLCHVDDIDDIICNKDLSQYFTKKPKTNIIF
ncbi:MAG: DeoR/GlpR transcriptional regulator [Clostridia bacterium]|nr:DeoR/GlpR transcriptional regulator [Clostridia bacterium]